MSLSGPKLTDPPRCFSGDPAGAATAAYYFVAMHNQSIEPGKRRAFFEEIYDKKHKDRATNVDRDAAGYNGEFQIAAVKSLRQIDVQRGLAAVEVEMVISGSNKVLPAKTFFKWDGSTWKRTDQPWQDPNPTEGVRIEWK